MLPKFFHTSLIALVVTIGSMAATVGSSEARSGYIDFTIGAPGIYYSSERRHHYRGHRRYMGRYEDRMYGRRACAPYRALRKARRFGIHRARVVRVNRRVVVVKGYRYGGRAKIIFGRSRHCPVVGYRNIDF